MHDVVELRQIEVNKVGTVAEAILGRSIKTVYPVNHFILVAAALAVDFNAVRFIKNIDIEAGIAVLEEELDKPLAGIGIHDCWRMRFIGFAHHQVRRASHLVGGDTAVEIDRIFQLLHRYPSALKEQAVGLVANADRLEATTLFLLNRLKAHLDTFGHQLVNQVPDQAAHVLAVTEHVYRLWRDRILVHFAQHRFQGIEHRILTAEVQGTNLIPGVTVDQVHAADQALLLRAVAEYVGILEVKLHRTVLQLGGRIIFQVNKQPQLTDFARAGQRLQTRLRTTDRKGIANIADQLVELVDIHRRIADHGMQTGRLGQQAIKIGPGHQLAQVSVMLQG